MAYNSAYTGSQVDAAVGAVRQKETIWDNKQDELTGTEDQLVGFNSAGEAVAVAKPDPLPTGGTQGQVLTQGTTGPEWQDAPSGLPDGGTPGQMLYQGENGPEWGDKPVMYVTITGDEESGYSADKTGDELIAAYNDGYALFAVIYEQSQPSYIAYLYVVTDIPDVKNVQFCGALGSPFVIIYGEPTNAVMVIFDNKISASKISFTPGATGLTAKNVQDAIEEVNEKIPSAPKSVSITLPASAWSSNAQTVTVQGVLADESAQLIQPMPAIASQNAYISAGVICSGQAANQLTFTCSTTPTEDISLYVVLTEVQS